MTDLSHLKARVERAKRRRWGRPVGITQYPHDEAFDEALNPPRKIIRTALNTQGDSNVG